jgi:hypothetical protein
MKNKTKKTDSEKKSKGEIKLHYVAELVKLSSLKEHPKNYRNHTQDQLEHIKSSIQTHGYYKNVITANDGTILAGHGVIKACKELKLDTIPIVRLNIKPDSMRAMKILTGDNEISKLGEVDDRLLSEILKDISKDEDGLLGTGFDEKQLANLVFVTRDASEIKDFNAAAEWLGMPEYDLEDESMKSEPVIMISFKNCEDRDRFIKETGLKFLYKQGNKRWSTMWPFEGRKDKKSVKFEAKKTKEK